MLKSYKIIDYNFVYNEPKRNHGIGVERMEYKYIFLNPQFFLQVWFCFQEYSQ